MRQIERLVAKDKTASDRSPEAAQAETSRTLARIELAVARLQMPEVSVAPIGTSAKPLPRV